MHLTARQVEDDPVGANAVLGVTSSLTGQSWQFRTSDDRAVLTLAQQAGLSEPLARVLAGRAIDISRADAYLAPSLKTQMPDPGCVTDMEKAAERVAGAIRAGETVAVFGDYDVDGATSSALIKLFFEAIRRSPVVYIPDRLTEGYGPNAAAFDTLSAGGAKVVVCVDCGTQAFDALAHGAGQGLDIVVLDHHAPGATLPDCHALVNPNRTDDRSGLGQLAAVGVTFLFVVALNRALRDSGWYRQEGITEPSLMSLLDLVALGTVCDVVPLTGVNRVFVAQGLQVLRWRQNLGLQTLCDVAGVNREPGVYELGFLLGPRVNAGGRIGRADLGTRLMTTRDPEEARSIAAELNHLNAERRDMEAHMLAEALALGEQTLAARPDTAVLVLANEGWHPGVIGIVASRVKDKFHRPAIVIGVDKNGIGKGSGRSLPGVDLGAAVLGAKQAGLLINGGGHPMAAGLTVEQGQVPALAEHLDKALARAVAENNRRRLRVDAVVHPGGLTGALLDEITRAAPFGTGNSEPVFVAARLQVSYADIVGGAHVKCSFIEPLSGARLNGIAFRTAETPLGQALLNRSGPLHIAGKLRRDDWRGGNAVQFVVEDGALAGAANDG